MRGSGNGWFIFRISESIRSSQGSIVNLDARYSGARLLTDFYYGFLFVTLSAKIFRV